MEFVLHCIGDVALRVWPSSISGALHHSCLPSQSNVEPGGSITLSLWSVVVLRAVKPWVYSLAG